MEKVVQQVKFPPKQPRLKRVAAYARVSSGKDAMLHSLAAQVEYYSNYIRRHPGWEYVGVYADEAKTGTKDSREQLQRLLTDCKAGKIDHIITKSISRMARNTVTLLETVRELKTMGITVYFEEQNIDTGTDDGELMLSILHPTPRRRAFPPAKTRNGGYGRILKTDNPGGDLCWGTVTRMVSTLWFQRKRKSSDPSTQTFWRARVSPPL